MSLKKAGITFICLYIISTSIPAQTNKDWSVAPAYSFSSSHELDLSIGRSFVAKTAFNGGGSLQTLNMGAAYGIAFKNKVARHLVKAFVEKTSSAHIIGYAARAEYFYDITAQQHYIRPYIGYSLGYFDLLYHYSILLNGGDNLFRNGITARIRFFGNSQNWKIAKQ